MKKIASCIMAAAMALNSSAADTANTQSVDYRPTFGGVFRTRWEMATDDGHGGENRFTVRNARVWLKGKIAPQLQYYLRADLCDMGTMKFLDGWARFTLPENFAVQAGQFRVPFGVDAFRGPGTYIFANRSFMGRDDANNRAVGIQGMYEPTSIPLKLHMGVFSNHKISDHTPWSKEMTFAAKATYEVGPVTFAAGFQTICPDSIRMNMADAAVTFKSGRFTAEGEYMYTHYTNDSYHDAHSFNVWADYGIPLKGFFKKWSFQGRIETVSSRSNGVCNNTGHLTQTFPKRQRLTVGTTLAYIRKPVKCELLLDYEKYFYKDSYSPSIDRDDKIVAELVVVF